MSSPSIHFQIQYDDESVINRLLELDSPVLYENMLPYLYEVSLAPSSLLCRNDTSIACWSIL